MVIVYKFGKRIPTRGEAFLTRIASYISRQTTNLEPNFASGDDVGAVLSRANWSDRRGFNRR